MRGIDYLPESIRYRNEQVAQWSHQAELIELPRRAKTFSPRQLIALLPENLDQALVMKERRHFAKAARIVARQLKRERSVYFVTVVNPNWGVPRGGLTPEAFSVPLLNAQRRARELAKHGYYRIAGTVDISFNDNSQLGEQSMWQPHLHLLVSIRVPENYAADRLLRDVFMPKCKIPYPGFKPVVVIEINTIADFLRIREYISSKLLARCKQLRIFYVDRKGKRRAKKAQLRKWQQIELLKLISITGARKRTILSGIRRDGDKFRKALQSTERKRHFRYTIKSMIYNTLIDTCDSYYESV